jgi:hypothetical protein
VLSELRSLAVVRSVAMNPGMTITGRPAPSTSRGTAGANAARIRVMGNDRASRTNKEKGGGRSSGCQTRTGLRNTPQGVVSISSGGGG